MKGALRIGRTVRRNQRGQTLVEFAAAITVFLFLIFGILDIGRAVYAYNALANAARQGARIAMVNQLEIPTSTSCDLDMPVENVSDPHWQVKPCTLKAAASLGLSPTAVTVAYSTPPGSQLACSSTLHVGCTASVTVTYQWAPVTPLASLALALFRLAGASGIPPSFDSVSMSSTSQMPIEAVFP